MGIMGGGILIVEGKGSQYRRRGRRKEKITPRSSKKPIRNHMTVYLLKITYVYVYLYKYMLNEAILLVLTMIPQRAIDYLTKMQYQAWEIPIEIVYQWNPIDSQNNMGYYMLLPLFVSQRHNALQIQDPEVPGCYLNSMPLKTRFHTTRRCFASDQARETTKSLIRLWWLWTTMMTSKAQ